MSPPEAGNRDGSSEEDDQDLEQPPKYRRLATGIRALGEASVGQVVQKPKVSSVLGLDRKAMEEERLRRLAVSAGSQRRGTSNTISQGAPLDSPEAPVETRMGQETRPAALSYPKGAVLRTWLRDQPRGDDIRIDEVLQKDQLELACLSSFQWDEEWLFSKIDPRTKVILIAFAANESQVRYDALAGTTKYPEATANAPS